MPAKRTPGNPPKNDSPAACTEAAYIQILSETCAVCKACCKGNVPEGICGYNTIEQILAGRVAEPLIKQLVIYQVKEADIDAAADRWWHFPFNQNLLKILTLPAKGIYEFLAVPYAKNQCIFCDDHGCTCPALKPFDCSMFPFYWRHGEFYKEKWCDLSHLLDDLAMRDMATKATREYTRFARQHQQEYFTELQKLKAKYSFTLLRFPA